MRVRPAIARTDHRLSGASSGPSSGHPPGHPLGSTPVSDPLAGAAALRAPGARRRLGLRGARPAVLAVMLGAAALAGCTSQRPDRSGLFEPYRTDLPQGNYVTREMLDQVRPGMSREQVRAALGAPLLTPVFRTDRWDYVFRYQHASGKVDSRRVTIRFRDDLVERIDADQLPEREDLNDPALPGVRPRAPNA